MNDLATIEKIHPKEKLERIEGATEIRGQIIPFKFRLPGQIQALPKYFTNEFPRKNLGTEPYSVIGYKSGAFEADVTAYRDILPNGKPIDIYFHQLQFEF